VAASPIASPPVAGFVRSGSLAALTLLNEAESGSLALRLTGSPSRASATELLPPPPGRLHCRMGNYRVSSFQLTRSARLILALQDLRKKPKERPTAFT